MKRLINSLAAFMLAILGITTFNSCADCSTVICNNGTCNNGICVCEPNSGYEKRGTGCLAVNHYFISEDSTFSTTITRVDSSGTTYAPLVNVAYDVIPSSLNPFMFKLKSFNGLTGNDIDFIIKNNNYSKIISQTFITSAQNYYTISGSRVDEEVTLIIIDLADDVTYTLKYTD